MEGETSCYWNRKMNSFQQTFPLDKERDFSYKKTSHRFKGGGKNTRKIDKSPIRTQKKKFRWYDGKGRQLTAGGLLPYDDKGIWVIGEKKTKNGDLEWTDAGGKYKFEDCDIYTTISREFREELYNSTSISREIVLQIKDSFTATYVNGHQNRPVYICYLVPVDILEKYGVFLNPTLFKDYRDKTLSENPDVPPEYYSSVELKHISFSEIEEAMQKSSPNPSIILSYRLKRILRYGPLVNKVCGSVPDRSITPDVSEAIPSDLDDDNEPENVVPKSKSIALKTETISVTKILVPIPCSPPGISYMTGAQSVLVGIHC